MIELDPRRAAVVAVHLQGDLVTRQGALGGIFADMVEKSGALEKAREIIAAARESGTAVAYARVVFSEGYPEMIANCPLLAMSQKLNALIDGTPGGAIVPDLTPQEGDIVIDHHRVSPTFGTSLAADLRARDVESVVVFGVATNIAVEATARTLADEGFRVIVAADACTTADEATHEAALATLGLLVAEIAATADVTAALQTGVAAA